MHKLITIISVAILIVHSSYGQRKVSNDKINIEALEIKHDSINANINQALNITDANIDSSYSELISNSEQIFSEIKKQNAEIAEIKQRLVQNDKSMFWEFFYPILLSIIAAIIFWVTFSYFPERTRKKKMRVKIDLEIHQVYSKLFALFDNVMRRNDNSPSDYQDLIRGKKLSKRDIEIGLQNKCLNESYLFYPEIKDSLLPIGNNLWNSEQKIDRLIDRIFNFSMYLHAEEILLLENIRNKLNTYELEDYNRNTVEEFRGMKLHPLNPSLSYMTNNFHELYLLYSELQDLVFSNKFENRNIYFSKVQYLFNSEQYDETIKTIKRGQSKYSKDINFLDTYVYQSLYKMNKRDEAYKKLEKIFESKPHLVSNRNALKHFLGDKKVKELLNKYFSDSQLKELNKVITQEKLKENLFIENAKRLEEFYRKKMTEYYKK